MGELRLAVLLLTLVTGFAGLVYEVAWQRYLANLLGSQSEATAAVLGLFLGSLAAGYALFGRLTRRWVAAARTGRRLPDLLRWYGFVEIGIGAYALVFPLLFEAASAVSVLGPLGGGAAGFAFDVLLSAALIGPPAVLMGATIPVLTQALARDLADATRVHALVYGSNTAGAFAGTLAAGFWLIPAHGLVVSVAAAGCIDLCAGVAFALLGTPGRTPLREAAAPAPAAPLAAFSAAAALAGFGMMTLQTTVIRLGALSLGSSELTFALVVATFVLCIALGSFAVSALPRVPRWLLPAALWALPATLLLLYGFLGDAPYWAYALRVVAPLGFHAHHVTAFAGLLAVLIVPLLLSGAALPLLFHHLRRELGDLGDRAGTLYGWNTAGSLLGALVGGYALLHWLDLHHVFRVAVAALIAAAALVSLRTGARRGLALAATAAALAVAAALPAWSPDHLAAGLFRRTPRASDLVGGPDAFFERRRGSRVVFHDDDPTASISVKEGKAGNRLNRSIITNGKSDSAVVYDYVTTALLGLIPALLARTPERALVVGYGTGVTAGELASLDSMREVLVAEISPAVIRAAPLFDYGNRNASHNPVVRIVSGDAYRTLRRIPGTFDVIVSEPSNPWVAGIERLYSREYLEVARDKLSPGGVHAQWMHNYETDDETMALALRTYASVFDYVSVWYTRGVSVLFLGFEDPEDALAVARLAERAGRPDFALALARSGVRDVPALLALLPLGVATRERLPGPLHSLLEPRLGYAAARAFYEGAQGALPRLSTPEARQVGREHSLVRRYAALRGAEFSEDERRSLVRETCRYRPRECATLLAWWWHEVPHSRSRQRLEDALRRKDAIDENLVAQLRLLYEEDGASQTPEGPRLYREYYHHAAPFSEPGPPRLGAESPGSAGASARSAYSP